MNKRCVDAYTLKQPLVQGVRIDNITFYVAGCSLTDKPTAQRASNRSQPWDGPGLRILEIHPRGLLADYAAIEQILIPIGAVILEATNEAEKSSLFGHSFNDHNTLFR